MATININKKIVNWKLTSSNSSQSNDRDAIKRPKELPCDIHQVKIKGENWTIIVGLLNNKPYEVFGGLSKFVEIPKKYKKGLLTKNNKVNNMTIYNLVIGTDDEQLVIKDIVNIFENKTHGAFTRLVSLGLRHGAAVHFIVEQLLKDKYSDMTSFSRVIARVLKNYIIEGTHSSLICENCHSNNVIFEGGCQKCLDCLTSHCG